MQILVSNDDGYQAEGIEILTQHLSRIAKVVVFAPNDNQSASSSSLSIGKALTPVAITPNIYAMNGTPSDCVHTALCGFFKNSFDLVVSGINLGANLGDDVIYSGTVAAAIEGRFLGLPSIAVSLASTTGSYYDTAASITSQLVANIARSGLSNSTILNINVPDLPLDKIRGTTTTRLGKRHASEAIMPIKNKVGSYYIGDNGKEADNGIGTDFYAIANRQVSITPLQIDLTYYQEMQGLSDWLEKL